MASSLVVYTSITHIALLHTQGVHKTVFLLIKFFYYYNFFNFSPELCSQRLEEEELQRVLEGCDMVRGGI